MSQPLWMSLEPRLEEVRLVLSVPTDGTVLKARLCSPHDPRSVSLLLEALAGWYGRALHAVLAADAPDVRSHPDRWALALGDAPETVRVQWVAYPVARRRDGSLSGLGEFAAARRLLNHAATGQP
jgi:hypothetical protein